jgi:hypothetical protein
MRFPVGRVLSFLSAAIIFAVVSASAQSAVLTVTNTDDSGPGSLRDTIASASDGDTIQFSPALKGQAITLTSGELAIGKSLNLNGPGADQLTIQRSHVSGTPDFRIFNITRGGTLSGLTISNGRADTGGGIEYSDRAVLTISDCVISGNSAASVGGGIFNAGANASAATITVLHTTISGNTAGTGGGIYIASPGPTAIHHGGSMSVTDSTISGNVAVTLGGGIANYGGLTLEKTTVSGNTTSDSSGGGGAILNAGALGVTDSTLSGNSAGQGGAIKSKPGWVFNPEDFTIVNSTITNNSATSGGGIDVTEVGHEKLRNTIVASNTSADGPDAKGEIQSQGFNLIGNSSGATVSTPQTSDQIGTPGSPIDPLLGPLQDNGGPTFTHALLDGSPAIDQGESSGSTTDQRGFRRPVDRPAIANAAGGDGADIGAFEAASASLRNIATRAPVGLGDNALIGGFIITGTDQKTIVVRGIGPSLGFAGVLADPVIEVYDGAGVLRATNDNWEEAATRQEIIDSGLAPSNSLEAALWGVVNPGTYTVVVRGKNGGTGIGLFDVYDLDGKANSRLANISTRAFVQTGNEVMIGGFIVLGQDSQKVIARAIGPSLAIPGALNDPTLELRDENGVLLAANDNWRSDQESDIIATGIPPSNDSESAIVRDLAPGNYTAIVRGSQDSTGIAVVEVYALR